MASRPPILPDMPIFGSDGVLVGTVHRVSGFRIILNRIGVSDADQHVIPLAHVADVTDRVILSCPAIDARPVNAGEEADKRRLIGPVGMLAVGVAGIALVYGVASFALHQHRTVPPQAAIVAVAALPVVRSPVERAARPVAVIPTVPAMLLPTSAVAVAAFLSSDLPTPQRFSLDSVSFMPGSATVDANGKAVMRSLARLLIAHPNTVVKLSASSASGAMGLRRAEAIKELLMGLGTAEYRIATGTARSSPRDGAKSGIEMIVLRK